MNGNAKDSMLLHHDNSIQNVLNKTTTCFEANKKSKYRSLEARQSAALRSGHKLKFSE